MTSGTLAAFAWLIASSVWGMTPSSAATTITAMSVTRAPRARIEVNASWPGVSRNTMRLPSLVVTSDAPMCWVMPPRSPAATVVERIASSRLVLPWSTWPMTVTIGARGDEVGLVLLLEQDLLGRLGGPARCRPRRRRPAVAAAASATSKPSSLATSEAVSRSISWLIVAKMPLLMSSRMMSAGLDGKQLGELLDRDRARQLDRAALARIDDRDARRGVKAPVRRGGLRGPRRPRVPLLLLATGSSFDGQYRWFGAGDVAPAMGFGARPRSAARAALTVVGIVVRSACSRARFRAAASQQAASRQR